VLIVPQYDFMPRSLQKGAFFMRIEYHPRFLNQLKRHEGLRLEAYICPAGALTIGYGHNLDVFPLWDLGEGDRISEAQAGQILELDARRFAADLDRELPRWRKLTEPRQAVLLNMAFNMGVAGLLRFRRMLSALEAGDFARAASEMLDSKWKSDVKGRAYELAAQMQSGEWQEG